jgi:uncharacterized linocin/CFP29 family protein
VPFELDRGRIDDVERGSTTQTGSLPEFAFTERRAILEGHFVAGITGIGQD